MRKKITLEMRKAEARSFMLSLGKVVHTRRKKIGPQCLFEPVVRQQTIAKIESAARTLRVQTLEHIAERLGTSAPTLLIEASVRMLPLGMRKKNRLLAVLRLFDELPYDRSLRRFRFELGGALRAARCGSKGEEDPRFGLREVAKNVELDHSFLSRVERGSSHISFLKLYVLCHYIELPLGVVLSRAYLALALLPKQRSSMIHRLVVSLY